MNKNLHTLHDLINCLNTSQYHTQSDSALLKSKMDMNIRNAFSSFSGYIKSWYLNPQNATDGCSAPCRIENGKLLLSMIYTFTSAEQALVYLLAGLMIGYTLGKLRMNRRRHIRLNTEILDAREVNLTRECPNNLQRDEPQNEGRRWASFTSARVHPSSSRRGNNLLGHGHNPYCINNKFRLDNQAMAGEYCATAPPLTPGFNRED